MIFTLFFGLRHRFIKKKDRISGEDLPFLVRWIGGGPLEPCYRTECGPLVQKVADPCGKPYHTMAKHS